MINWNLGTLVTAIGIGLIVIGGILATIGHFTGSDRVFSIGWNIAIWGLITVGAGAVWWYKALKGAHAIVVVACTVAMGLIATKIQLGSEDFIEEDDWEVKNQLENLYKASNGEIPSHGIVLIREEVVGREFRWYVPEWNEMPVEYKNGDKVLEYWIDSPSSTSIKVRQALVVDASSNPPVFEEILALTEVESRGVGGADIFEGDRWTVIKLTKGGII